MNSTNKMSTAGSVLRPQPEPRVIQPEIPYKVLLDWLGCIPTFEAGFAQYEQWQRDNPSLPDPVFDADMAAWLLELLAHDFENQVRFDRVAGIFTQAVQVQRGARFAVTLTAENSNIGRNDACFDPALAQLLTHASALGVTVTITMTNPEYLDPTNPHVTDGVHTTILKPRPETSEGREPTTPEPFRSMPPDGVGPTRPEGPPQSS
jgi:hypothetical protein